MDQREASMRLPGPASYYMNQGTSEPILQNTPSMSPFSSSTIPFQSNTLGNLSATVLPVDDPSTHGTSAIPAPNVLLQGEPVRRKRGRPRKYGHDAAVSLALSPSISRAVSVMRPSQKRRGRPPGSSRNKPPQVSSSLGSMNLSSASLFNGTGTMTPHIINVAAGEDIKRRILSLVRGRGAIVVLSGVGSVSAANIRVSGSGGSVTYEGRFDILTLSGSYVNDADTPQGPTGGLNVTLSGPDGRVTGGQVEAVLIAASVVQVIIGSLQPRSSKAKLKVVEDPQPSKLGDSSISANIQPNQNNPMSSWQSTQ